MKLTLLAKKGGVGKSTVSLLLYEAFRQAGKTVMIQDWDSQGTSSKSLELIGSGEGPRPAKPDIVIYDTPPSLEHTATATAVRNADIALVITSPAPADIWEAEEGGEVRAGAKPEGSRSSDVQQGAQRNDPWPVSG